MLMMTNLPFAGSSAPTARPSNELFNSPDIRRKAFADVGSETSFSNEAEDEEYIKSVEELMAQSDYLDECNAEDEVVIDTEGDDINGEFSQIPTIDEVPAAQQKSTSSPPIPKPEIETPPSPKVSAEASQLARMTPPSIPSPPVELSSSTVDDISALSPQLRSQSEKITKAITYKGEYGYEEIPRLASDDIAAKVISKTSAINVNGVLYAYADPIYRKLTPDLIKGLVLKYCAVDLAKTQFIAKVLMWEDRLEIQWKF